MCAENCHVFHIERDPFWKTPPLLATEHVFDTVLFVIGENFTLFFYISSPPARSWSRKCNFHSSRFPLLLPISCFALAECSLVCLISRICVDGIPCSIAMHQKKKGKGQVFSFYLISRFFFLLFLAFRFGDNRCPCATFYSCSSPLS